MDVGEVEGLLEQSLGDVLSDEFISDIQHLQEKRNTEGWYTVFRTVMPIYTSFLPVKIFSSL